MIHKKMCGFLVMESMIGLIIACIGITTVELIIGESRLIERKIEQKTDRTYAWNVMKKTNVKQVMIHDRLYRFVDNKKILDVKNNKKYEIKK